MGEDSDFKFSTGLLESIRHKTKHGKLFEYHWILCFVCAATFLGILGALSIPCNALLSFVLVSLGGISTSLQERNTNHGLCWMRKMSTMGKVTGKDSFRLKFIVMAIIFTYLVRTVKT